MFAGPWPNCFQVLQSGTCRLVCIHASTCVCVFASICISMHAAMHSCLCIFVCTHVPASAHEKSVSICSVTLHIYAHAFVCLCFFWCLHACICVYIYICMYVCMCVSRVCMSTLDLFGCSLFPFFLHGCSSVKCAPSHRHSRERAQFVLVSFP